jgi:DNA invertase Pin-like site-specific DNA recombinase
MTKQKLTILYERLSRDDGEDSVSNSIKNQRAMLEEYAERNNLKPYLHIQDDGYSGTNFSRPGWTELMNRVEADEVSAILFKTMDRMSRDYLRSGLYREIFRDKGIRIISVTEGIDSANGEDDFMPFREIMAEWYARDTSRKIKSTIIAKGNSGKPLASQPPYGYIKDPNDKTRWVVEPEAAAIVKRIFQMVIDGMGPWAIAAKLYDERVECPSHYHARRGTGSRGDNYDKDHPYSWSYTMIGQMLTKQEYLGYTVNFKTERPNFKSKKFVRRPTEEWKVFENTHEAIIDQKTFDTVQKLRSTVRRPSKSGELNPLTGLLFCADCGAKMHNKRYRNTDVYHCSTSKVGEFKFDHLCTTHHIRSEAVRDIILDALRRTSSFVREHEADFVKLVHEKSAFRHGEALKSSKKQAAKNEKRIAELDKLIVSIYEDKVKGLLPENRFSIMAAAYEAEQADLKEQTAALRAELDAYKADSDNAEKFIALTRRYTQFDELTPVILNEFVDKLIIHEGVWSEGVNPVTNRGMGTRRQKVDVYLKYIGDMEIPDLRPWEEIEAEINDVLKAEKNATRLRENRRRYVAGEAKKRNPTA